MKASRWWTAPARWAAQPGRAGRFWRSSRPTRRRPAHRCGRWGAERVLSIVAGVTLRSLQSWLASRSTAVVRAMPNTPALVGSGAAAIAGGPAAGTRRPGLGSEHAGGGRHGRGGLRAGPRRGHRVVGLRARLRVPAGRGADRRRRAWSAWPGPSPGNSPSRPCWGRPACWPRPATSRPPSGPRSPPPAAPPRPACGRSRRPGCATPCWRRWRPRPGVARSWAVRRSPLRFWYLSLL